MTQAKVDEAIPIDMLNEGLLLLEGELAALEHSLWDEDGRLDEMRDVGRMQIFVQGMLPGIISRLANRATRATDSEILPGAIADCAGLFERTIWSSRDHQVIELHDKLREFICKIRQIT